ncbi:MAG: M3 family metallopeptidase [Abyssibacter sp.]|nr:M3 family metallopeptidase [Abyssibacter sp.]MCK5859946.1 M3 family metallopeptidase [Abyssibacter sp.]
MRIISLLVAATLTACANHPLPIMKTASNPLLQPSPLPYEYPLFDRIKPDHFMPAFEVGMEESLEQVDTIASQSEAPTFDNTIVALEKSGRTLNRVQTVFYNLVGTHGTEALQAIDETISPQLAAHRDKIFLNTKLFERIDTLYRERGSLGLDAEASRLLERYHVSFVRAGARLGADDQQRLREINTELSRLTTQFQQNLLKHTNELAVVVDDPAQLAGLSESAIEAAAATAKSRGVDGYVLTLQLPTLQPQLAELENRALRERLHRASIQRGNTDGTLDNRPVLQAIVALRAERARLLGYDTHADYVLANATAGTADAVNKLLAKLAKPSAANAGKEAARLQQAVDAAGESFDLKVWDWPYYREIVRQQDYDFDQTALKPYFEMQRVLEDGVFFMAEKLYGLRFERRDHLPVYHPDTTVYEVFQDNGSALGIFIFDPFARDTKRGGAWMNSYVRQSRLLGTRPVVANHLNITKPAGDGPVLMTPSEVNTMFHEFGHAVHGLLSNVHYPFFSGTAVPRDFVEYPSQVHEMWAFWPEVMANYARHYETGEALPPAMIERYKSTELFNQGYDTTEYLAASLLDQAWHQLTPDAMPDDVETFEMQALEQAGVALELVPPRYRSTYFAHVFSGGYSAGYYSYVWSEVLDADTVAWFKEDGGLSRKNGDRMRYGILSLGGSVDAQQMYEAFRGRPAAIEPLLERRGLTAE